MKFLKIPILFLCGLLLFSGSAFAYFLGGEDVGGLDKIDSFTNVGGDSAELTWINDYLDTSYPSTQVIKYDTPDQWAAVDGPDNSGIYALELMYNPEWFAIKIGTGGTDIKYDTILYHNEDMLHWAVVDAAEWLGLSDNNIVSLQVNSIPNNIDSSRISNVMQPVHEPATMFLFGIGIIGLAGIGRMKFFKK